MMMMMMMKLGCALQLARSTLTVRSLNCAPISPGVPCGTCVMRSLPGVETRVVACHQKQLLCTSASTLSCGSCFV
jgi:hypothetical protein